MHLMKSFDHAWRLFATTLSFTVFGIGGLIMGLFIFPIMFVFIRDGELRKFFARKLVGIPAGPIGSRPWPEMERRPSVRLARHVASQPAKKASPGGQRLLANPGRSSSVPIGRVACRHEYQSGRNRVRLRLFRSSPFHAGIQTPYNADTGCLPQEFRKTGMIAVTSGDCGHFMCPIL